MHRRIYAAIRDHDSERARLEMSKHLDLARMAQASEDTIQPAATGAAAPPENR
jgi:DNA-binding FadR family transcriptional regulator